MCAAAAVQIPGGKESSVQRADVVAEHVSEPAGGRERGDSGKAEQVDAGQQKVRRDGAPGRAAERAQPRLSTLSAHVAELVPEQGDREGDRQHEELGSGEIDEQQPGRPRATSRHTLGLTSARWQSSTPQTNAG